jgi:hypothetical protein
MFTHPDRRKGGANTWVLGLLVPALLVSCSDSSDGPDLDALVSEGRVGSGGGGGVGVAPDPPDTGSADAGDGSGQSDAQNLDPVTDVDRHRLILQSARRSSDTCSASCSEASLCVLSIQQDLCATSCANIPALIDRATDDSVEALRCARSYESLWTCISAEFSCEDFVYATEGRFTRCAVLAENVNVDCEAYGITARQLLQL